MKAQPVKRLVVDLPADDHASLKAFAASSGASIRHLVLSAVRADLERRRAALSDRTDAPRPRP